MKTYRVKDGMNSFTMEAENRDQVMYEAMRRWFPDCLDDDLPDREDQVEIVEL